MLQQGTIWGDYAADSQFSTVAGHPHRLQAGFTFGDFSTASAVSLSNWQTIIDDDVFI
jgi:hypothetical protein